MSIAKITNVKTIKYSATKQIVTYIEWVDHKGVAGRTESFNANPHMEALIARAEREGVAHHLFSL